MVGPVAGAAEIRRGADQFRLRLPAPKVLTLEEELDLLQRKHRNFAATAEQKRRLSRLLVTADRFDDAIEVLSKLEVAQHYGDRMTLGRSHLSRETIKDNEVALHHLEAAADLADTPQRLGASLAGVGKAKRRLGRTDEARHVLADALAVDIASRDAFKRLNAIDIETGRSGVALSFADSLIARNVCHARVLAGRALSLAALGRIDESLDMIGLDRFLCTKMLSPPSGWTTMEAFNRDLSGELATHPGRRGDRYGSASVLSQRIDEPHTTRSRIVPHALEMIRREVEAYVAHLPGEVHPLIQATPGPALLRCWAVMTDGAGYEDWHVHQNGWISGVYYVNVPAVVADASDREGCIAFGLPPNVVGEGRAANAGLHVVRPEAGLLLVFPSHGYHRTFPHRSIERRICIAFDVVPDGFSEAGNAG